MPRVMSIHSGRLQEPEPVLIENVQFGLFCFLNKEMVFRHLLEGKREMYFSYSNKVKQSLLIFLWKEQFKRVIRKHGSVGCSIGNFPDAT